MNKAKKILIIEDNEIDLQLEEFLLSSYTLYTAKSLKEGIEILDKDEIDIIIADLDLKDFHISLSSNKLKHYPLIVIYNLLQYLKSRIKETLVIVVSGYYKEDHCKIALQLGCQDYISKAELMTNKNLLVESINKGGARLDFIGSLNTAVLFSRSLMQILSESKKLFMSIVKKE